MYTTYLRQDKKIGMYVDFGVLCTRYLISGWDFPRILFWKRSNLAKKSLQLSPLSISSHRVLNFIYIQDKKRLKVRIATSSTPARYSHCICTEIHNSIETFCHFCMFPKIKRYIHSVSNPEAKKNNLIRMPLALSLYQMRIFPQKTST